VTQLTHLREKPIGYDFRARSNLPVGLKKPWGVTLRHRTLKGARMWDQDVRVAVRHRLKCEHDGDEDTRIVEEMGIWNGTVRVDLAVINGELTGYEIKSARDTLTRLASQAALYNSVFDRVFLVAADRHIERANSEIPEWWGIISAISDGNAVTLRTLRCGEVNPSLDAIQLARLLWREEILSVLEACGAARGYRSASREILSVRLADVLGIDTLAAEVRARLKGRKEWLRHPVGN
jgi:hypothetical protein